MGDERTIPSLFMSAYNACNDVQLTKYYKHNVPRVDLRKCCVSLFKIVSLNSEDGVFDQFGDRRSMFGKVKDNDKNNESKKFCENNIFTKAFENNEFENICDVAASHGHIDCLQFAFEIGCPRDEDMLCTAAARGGHVDCLAYAHQNGCPWNEDTCTVAAESGHIGCLVYAHQNGCPWDIWTCYAAAINKRIDCLVYARQNGCPWDLFTCVVDAGDGHMDCLAYAHQNDCPWDKKKCIDLCNGNVYFVRYAYIH